MQILFFSAMAVAPTTGGGNTVYNLLEPSPQGCTVYYATPAYSGRAPTIFPATRERTSFLRMPTVRGARFKPVRHLYRRIAQVTVAAQLKRLCRQLDIDLLLACPQDATVDLAPALFIAKQPGVSVISWFMDNYFQSQREIQQVRALWQCSGHRLVISEAMQQQFERAYGCGSTVLNNSVDFPAAPPSVHVAQEQTLRLAYAGSLNGYYRQAMAHVLDELSEVYPAISIDIFSSDEPLDAEAPGRWEHYRQYPALPNSELLAHLATYDALLLLSSFEEHHRTIAETSLASKIADYLAAARCIVAFGPAYAENVDYVRRYNLGVAVTSAAPGALRERLLAMRFESTLRTRLGLQAFVFGKARHNRATNRDILWRIVVEQLRSKGIQGA